MPQVGWIDSSTGEKKTFKEWLQEAALYGDALGLPYEVLNGIASANNKERPDGHTVTQLLGCLRKVSLEKEVEYYSDPLDNYAAFRGTLVHALMEEHADPWTMTEMRYYRDFQGVEVSGQIDNWRITGYRGEYLTEEWHNWVLDGGDPDEQPHLDDDNRILIIDYKTKHELPTFQYLAKAYQKQGNLYRWLLRVPKGKADVRFVFMSMEGIRVMEMMDGGKFKNGRAKPEQFWSEAEVEQFLKERLLWLDEDVIRYTDVAEDDLWNCKYCPVKHECYRLAVKEAHQAWANGEKVDRLPPR